MHSYQAVFVEPGEAVTLQCSLEEKSSLFVWYKQTAGQLPQQVGMTGPVMGVIVFPPFKNTFKLERTKNTVSLTISRASKEDEGMYFCGSQVNVITFTNGTYLAVSGNHSVFPLTFDNTFFDSCLNENFTDFAKLLKSSMV